MSILRWDTPKKALTPAAWAESYGFEDGPTGGYVPNMSPADARSWRAKITGTKLGYPQVEIKKTTDQGSLVVIIVNLGAGYNYNQYRSSPFTDPKKMWAFRPGVLKGINVHLATNGPIQMTFAEMQEMQGAVDEARLALESLECGESKPKSG